MDQEETKEVQENQIFFEEKRGTSDLVLQARAKLNDDKVNGPEDAVASEMIKILPLEKIYTLARCFQDRSMGQMDAPSSWKIVKFVFLRTPGRRTKEGNQELQSDCTQQCRVEAVRVLCDDAHGKGKEPETWQRLHMGGVNNISCQHLQVLVTNLSQKHLGMARGSISHVETWQRESTNNVYGKLGHQVSLRRGKAEAYCENSGESQYTRMVDRGPLT